MELPSAAAVVPRGGAGLALPQGLRVQPSDPELVRMLMALLAGEQPPEYVARPPASAPSVMALPPERIPHAWVESVAGNALAQELVCSFQMRSLQDLVSAGPGHSPAALPAFYFLSHHLPRNRASRKDPSRLEVLRNFAAMGGPVWAGNATDFFHVLQGDGGQWQVLKDRKKGDPCPSAHPCPGVQGPGGGQGGGAKRGRATGPAGQAGARQPIKDIADTCCCPALVARGTASSKEAGWTMHDFYVEKLGPSLAALPGARALLWAREGAADAHQAAGAGDAGGLGCGAPPGGAGGGGGALQDASAGAAPRRLMLCKLEPKGPVLRGPRGIHRSQDLAAHEQGHAAAAAAAAAPSSSSSGAETPQRQEQGQGMEEGSLELEEAMIILDLYEQDIDTQCGEGNTGTAAGAASLHGMQAQEEQQPTNGMAFWEPSEGPRAFEPGGLQRTEIQGVPGGGEGQRVGLQLQLLLQGYQEQSSLLQGHGEQLQPLLAFHQHQQQQLQQLQQGQQALVQSQVLQQDQQQIVEMLLQQQQEQQQLQQRCEQQLLQLLQSLTSSTAPQLIHQGPQGLGDPAQWPGQSGWHPASSAARSTEVVPLPLTSLAPAFAESLEEDLASDPLATALRASFLGEGDENEDEDDDAAVFEEDVEDKWAWLLSDAPAGRQASEVLVGGGLVGQGSAGHQHEHQHEHEDYQEEQQQQQQQQQQLQQFQQENMQQQNRLNPVNGDWQIQQGGAVGGGETANADAGGRKRKRAGNDGGSPPVGPGHGEARPAFRVPRTPLGSMLAPHSEGPNELERTPEELVKAALTPARRALGSLKAWVQSTLVEPLSAWLGRSQGSSELADARSQHEGRASKGRESPEHTASKGLLIHTTSGDDQERGEGSPLSSPRSVGNAPELPSPTVLRGGPREEDSVLQEVRIGDEEVHTVVFRCPFSDPDSVW